MTCIYNPTRPPCLLCPRVGEKNVAELLLSDKEEERSTTISLNFSFVKQICEAVNHFMKCLGGISQCIT